MQKVVAKKAESGYTLAMQIERQVATNEYTAPSFRLCVFKGKYTKGKNIFTSWVTESSVVAVDISRHDTARILRRVRKENQFRKQLAQLSA